MQGYIRGTLGLDSALLLGGGGRGRGKDLGCAHEPTFHLITPATHKCFFKVTANANARTVLKAAGMIGQMPYCQRPSLTHSHTPRREETHPTCKAAKPPSSILVKNKYFKIMQTRATLALLSSMHMDYLQIEKYRLFCSYGIFFSSSPPSPKCLCPNQPFNIQPPKVLRTYCKSGRDS